MPFRRHDQMVVHRQAHSPPGSDDLTGQLPVALRGFQASPGWLCARSNPEALRSSAFLRISLGYTAVWSTVPS